MTQIIFMTHSTFMFQTTYFIFFYISSLSLSNLIIMVLEKEPIRFVSLDPCFPKLTVLLCTATFSFGLMLPSRSASLLF